MITLEPHDTLEVRDLHRQGKHRRDVADYRHRLTSTPNGRKIFSVKRGAWGDYARGVLESDLDKLVARVAVLEGHHDEPLKWYEDPKKQIDGALALGSLAFILGFIGTVLGGVALTKIKRMSGGKYSNNIV